LKIGDSVLILGNVKVNNFNLRLGMDCDPKFGERRGSVNEMHWNTESVTNFDKVWGEQPGKLNEND